MSKQIWKPIEDGDITFSRGIGWLDDGVLEIDVDEDGSASVELDGNQALCQLDKDDGS